MEPNFARRPLTEPQQLLVDLCQAEKFVEAEDLARLIIASDATCGLAWTALSVALIQQGSLDDALDASRKALMLSPQDAEASNNLGNILQMLGRLAEALIAYEQAITIKPDYAEARNNLGTLQKALGNLEAAEANYREALEVNPVFAEVHNNLGITLHALRRYTEAEDSYREAISVNAKYADAYNNLGITLQELGRLQEARSKHLQAIELSSESAGNHYNLGLVLQQLGQLGEAEAHYVQAITLQPDLAEAYRSLSELRGSSIKKEHFRSLRSIHEDMNCSIAQRCHSCFALARAEESLGHYASAFKYYREGNKLRKTVLNYDVSKNVELFEKLMNFQSELARASLLEEQPSTLKPIFIVGMPRSGTTLIEQIISAHSEVTGAGELPFASELGAEIAVGAINNTQGELQKFRGAYLHALQARSDGQQIATDKMPLNFRLLGLLAAAFPEAKIVHVKRDPAAVCWANYTTYFEAEALGYCYDLNDILAYYAMYEELMKFWVSALPGRIYELDYDLLTTNQNEETKKLINYLELFWEDNCLRPEDNQRGVSTASNIQVRQKIYQDSSQKWRRYQPFLHGAFDHFIAGE